jgi:predicted enzyme related to lactoylglutathione lyase
MGRCDFGQINLRDTRHPQLKSWRPKGDPYMKKQLAAAVFSVLVIVTAVASLSGQLAAPTSAGVSLGAVYYTVPDVTAHKKIWVDIFGAKPVMVGKTEMLKIPGAFIVLSRGEAAAGNPLINHLGIWAKDLEPTRVKLNEAGIKVAPKAQFVDLPNALRLEFIDDPAGPDMPAAHHIHYFVANQQDGLNARAWYMKTFGASENSRRNGGVPSALLTPADKWISIDFTAAGGRGRGGAAPPPAPSSNKGTILDRFAFEVRGIDAFVKKIEAEGVKVTKPVATNSDGLKTAMIVDSLGNDVELIEGLAGK